MGWLGKSSDSDRIINNELAATASALAENMNLEGRAGDNRVTLKVDKSGLLQDILLRLNRDTQKHILVRRILEVRDDVQALERNFAGYTYHR